MKNSEVTKYLREITRIGRQEEATPELSLREPLLRLARRGLLPRKLKRLRRPGVGRVPLIDVRLRVTIVRRLVADGSQIRCGRVFVHPRRNDLDESALRHRAQRDRCPGNLRLDFIEAEIPFGTRLRKLLHNRTLLAPSQLVRLGASVKSHKLRGNVAMASARTVVLAKVALARAATGDFRSTETMRAFTEEEVAKIVAALP